jgi:ATP-dependent Lhr-like helicase
VVTREAVMAENSPGGFGMVYPVLKGMEENGRVRRGYFIAGLGATQFAIPGALDLLRSLRDAPDEAEIAVLAATDPANPYGATLKWPPRNAAVASADAGRGATRSVGATVILVNGSLAAYLARGDRQLTMWLPDAEPERSKTARAVARVLIDRARSAPWTAETSDGSPRGMLIEEIDGVPPSLHPMAPFLGEAGFVSGSMGMQATYPRPHHVGGGPAAGEGDRPADRGAGRPSFARRGSKSTVSSPFARRYYEDDPPTDPSGED